MRIGGGNLRGLGGVSVTSDHFYNAGWTGDMRVVLGYLQQKYPNAPIFAVGTSIGANVLIEEKRSSESSGKQEPLINQGPYLNIAEDGLVASVKYEKDTNTTTASSKQRGQNLEEDVTKRSFKELCRQMKRPVWLLGYIGMVTGLPLLGLLLNNLFRKKQRPTTTSKS